MQTTTRYNVLLVISGKDPAVTAPKLRRELDYRRVKYPEIFRFGSQSSVIIVHRV